MVASRPTPRRMAEMLAKTVLPLDTMAIIAFQLKLADFVEEVHTNDFSPELGNVVG
jgi:hypothetical protein